MKEIGGYLYSLRNDKEIIKIDTTSGTTDTMIMRPNTNCYLDILIVIMTQHYSLSIQRSFILDHLLITSPGIR